MYDYETLSTEYQNGIMTVTISNPPINVMTAKLYMELVGFTSEVAEDERVKVVVFESADPDFFIAHFDVELILTFPTDKPAEKQQQLSDFHLMCERVRTMPKATIAKINGRAGGGGNEFCAACDMRFGVRGVTRFNQMEVPLGILPGGTGTQHLPRLMGRGRAMEVILGGDDLDAETAEQWGYLNRAFATPAEMDAHVQQLAERIALWPKGAIARAKASVLNSELPIEQGMLEEAYLFQQTLRDPEAQAIMRAALQQGAQTREGELRINDLVVETAKSLGPED
ncbi:MAG: enoyl-CoA hydratase/isomerase family protein [Pseudomonadales bacterium]